MQRLSNKIINRLTLYHCVLRHTLTDKAFVASQELAGLLRLDDSQVRKDIALCGVLGRQKHGYPVSDLKQAIEKTLGFAERKGVFVIGAGNLGSALINYADFRDYGIDITALFDNDPLKIGQIMNDTPVYALAELADQMRRQNIKNIILAVPPKAAQSVVDEAVQGGARFIWNFTPCVVRVPDTVVVCYENIISGFLQMQNG